MKAALLVVLASCGWLPPDSPPQPPTPVDRELAALAHTWVVGDHVLSGRSELTDADARAMTGRKVEITEGTYRSPWRGSCDDAARASRKRKLAALLRELDLGDEARATASRFGFGDPITQFDLSCHNGRVPGMAIYVSGERAMTCHAGVCYLLSREKSR